MSYTITYFQTLCETYPTWDLLEAYLQSVQVRIVADPASELCILRLQATSTCKDPWLRSVIWNKTTNRPVCVAPPKAETTDVNAAAGTDFPLIQDFLDGTMINAFRVGSEVHIATRSQIGATGTFYSKKTFAQMFQEALHVPLETLVAEGKFVSFLLQHPEHRVVARCHVPRLFAIHEGSVDASGLVTIQEKPNGLCLVPPSHPMSGFASTADLDSFFVSLTGSHGWFWQGLVFKDGKGKRWRLRNPNYVYLRELRGAEASSEERFLRLRSQGKVIEYLKHFSEERDEFWCHEQSLRAQTQCVYMAYVDVHKTRTKKLGDLAKILQPFVFRLHSKFLAAAAAGTKVPITLKEAIELVNSAPMFEKRRLLTTPTQVSA